MCGSLISDHCFPTETRGTFLEQMVGLQDSVKATWEQLQVLRGGVHCAQAGAQKTCFQLAELEETLRSSEEETLRAASALSFLVPGSPNPASPGARVGVFVPRPSPALNRSPVVWRTDRMFDATCKLAHPGSPSLTEKGTVCQEQTCVERTAGTQWWAGSLHFPCAGSLPTERWCHG